MSPMEGDRQDTVHCCSHPSSVAVDVGKRSDEGLMNERADEKRHQTNLKREYDPTTNMKSLYISQDIPHVC